MTDVFKGIVAGSVATFAMSGLMLLQSAAGILPQLSLIQLLLVVVDAPREPVLAWVLHFILGSVAGGAVFAHIEPRLGADSHTKSGILYGVLLWLLMMFVFLPAARGGYFGFQITIWSPIVMLALHLTYGAVLGWTYGKLAPTHDPLATRHAA